MVEYPVQRLVKAGLVNIGVVVRYMGGLVREYLRKYVEKFREEGPDAYVLLSSMETSALRNGRPQR